jgi:hypothetical protein
VAAALDLCEVVAGLPELRRLELAADEIPIEGLLKLRGARRLNTLVLHGVELTHAELALLEANLPQVDIMSFRSDRPSAYQRLVQSRLPLAPALAADQVMSRRTALPGPASGDPGRRVPTAVASSESEAAVATGS